ncbi:trans-sulfuration enzyme family protein, partial [Achromobacter xylosoxidans]
MSPYSDSYTRLAQAAVSPPESSYPVAPPLYQTASFATDEASVFLDMATRPLHSGFYTRYGNPTTRAFESAVADLEGGECALATASGMGAITAALFAFAARGDHVVAQRVLYGGTTGLLQNIAPQLGIDVTFVDQADVAGFAAAVRPNTRLFMLESPSNPMLRLTDLARLAEIARARGITTLADNTIASPINQRPLEFGIDLVMHSATKYLCGHGDVSAGVLVGDERRIKAVWEKAYLLGATLDPFAAWLVLRGLRTLPMRVARQNETALKVARHLEAH